MKKRHHLPLLAKLNLDIDFDRLKKEFYEFGYDNWELYNGLSRDTNQDDGLLVRRILLEYFLNDKELEERNGKMIVDGGDAYKMLCITGYDGDAKADTKSLLDKVERAGPYSLAKKLEKISDPSHPDYVPLADERNYTKRNEFCKGYLSELMDKIEKEIGPIARSRFAVLKAGEEIKPHIDINTDKAIRIHIPIITDPKCTVGVQGKKTTQEIHMEEGGVYFLNQGYKHWVKNDSDVDRVHLMFVVMGQNLNYERTWDDTHSNDEVVAA